MNRFKKILHEYSNQAVNFLVIYIEEAHSLEEWSLPNNKYKLHQAVSVQDRISAAKMLDSDEELSCPILIDDMKNEALTAYGALPERLYILYNDKVAYERSMGPIFYNLEEMKKVLDSLLIQQAKLH